MSAENICANCHEPKPYLILTPLTVMVGNDYHTRVFYKPDEPKGLCLDCVAFEAEEVMEGEEHEDA
jgi:hypothetical protein